MVGFIQMKQFIQLFAKNQRSLTHSHSRPPSPGSGLRLAFRPPPVGK